MRISLFVILLPLISCTEQSVDTQRLENREAKLEQRVNSKVSLDAASLIGLSKSEIDEQFGKPQCPPKNACVYGDMFEIYFIDDLAANLTLPPVENVSSYGFIVGAPDFEKDGIVRRWKIEGKLTSLEVSQFPNYVYVKSSEP